MQPTLTQEEIITKLNEHYPSWVCLRYVDYLDNLSENPDVMEAILQWDHDLINDKIDNRWDTRDTINQILEEVFPSDTHEHDDALLDTVSNRCRENDDSDPMSYLIKNTNGPLAYYDTGVYLEDPDWMSVEEMKTECIAACRKLWVHTKYAKNLVRTYREAYYGGSLIFIINIDLSDFYNKETPKYIKFNGTTKIGIIHFGNWSWDYADIKLSEKDLCFNYDPARLVIDATEKYWIQEIFGVSTDIWSPYQVANSKTGTTYCRLPWESAAKQRKAEEEEYKKTYREWWCTYSDSDINRHRKAFYRNEPMSCWHKCPDCWRYRAD